MYRGDRAPPVLAPSARNALRYEGHERWVITSNDRVVSNLTTDDLRISIVYRARCFKDAEVLLVLRSPLVRAHARHAGQEAQDFRLCAALVFGRSSLLTSCTRLPDEKKLQLDEVLGTLKRDLAARGCVSLCLGCCG